MNKAIKELLDKLIEITNKKNIKFRLIPNNIFEGHCDIIYVFIEGHIEKNMEVLEMIQPKNNMVKIAKQTFNTALYEFYIESNISYNKYLDYYDSNINKD